MIQDKEAHDADDMIIVWKPHDAQDVESLPNVPGSEGVPSTLKDDSL